MGSIHLLAARAAQLNISAGGLPIPALFFFTDPERTPDPCAIARRLPRGTAIVYRHFGAAIRFRVARSLAAIARARGLKLLIAADSELAHRVGANGVHWPEKRLCERGDAELVTASAHSAYSVARARNLGVDACVLGPLFVTRSNAKRRPLGLFHASQLARAAAMPVIALGGIDASRARLLAGRGFAGIAAVDAFIDA